MENHYFCVNASRYVAEKNFGIYYPSSIVNPKSDSVMFITKGYEKYISVLNDVNKCLVFIDETIPISDKILEKHAVVKCKDARKNYCLFFMENDITNLPIKEDMDYKDGAFISKKANIGNCCTIFPGAYIGGAVTLGNDCYIGPGVKLVGKVIVGDRVVIRENTVVGADGLSTDRDSRGRAITMPQFGGVVVGGDVKIGANVVIARGAIDDTIIEPGCKIDNSCFISHNVRLGKNTFLVGETILFGSSSTDENVFISGNSSVRNGVHIGKNSIVGMGSVVVGDVEDEKTVWGNPAKGK